MNTVKNSLLIFRAFRGSAFRLHLRNETFRRGAIPYYGTSLSNLPSWKTALECGFKPFWVEAESQPNEKTEFVK